MDIFFNHEHRYVVEEKLDSVRANIKSITSRSWHDFSTNITGQLHADDSFKLTHKWSFAVIKWIEDSPAYLNGTITVEGDCTIIATTLRPNSIFVIAFYLLTIPFLWELTLIVKFNKQPDTFNLLFYPLFNLILFMLMKMYTTGLKNRFERLLQLRGPK